MALVWTHSNRFLSYLCWEVDAALQVGSHRSRGEGQNCLPQPAAHPSFDAAQETIGFLGFKPALLSHVLCLIHPHPQVLLSRVALCVFIPQLLLISGSALTQVQDLTLGLVEPHGAPMDHFSRLSRSLWMASNLSCRCLHVSWVAQLYS